MVRSRNRRTHTLPPNLYEERRGKGIYYRFRDPVSGERRYIGSSRKQAVQTAHRINREIELESAGRLDDLINSFANERERVRRQAPTFAEFTKAYITKILPDARWHRGKAYSEDTLREKKRHLLDAAEDFGALYLTEITTRDIKQHLVEFEDRPQSHNNRRSTLQKAFNSAIEKGTESTIRSSQPQLFRCKAVALD